jgi:hypothetical protein
MTAVARSGPSSLLSPGYLCHDPWGRRHLALVPLADDLDALCGCAVSRGLPATWPELSTVDCDQCRTAFTEAVTRR